MNFQWVTNRDIGRAFHRIVRFDEVPVALGRDALVGMPVGGCGLPMSGAGVSYHDTAPADRICQRRGCAEATEWWDHVPTVAEFMDHEVNERRQLEIDRQAHDDRWRRIAAETAGRPMEIHPEYEAFRRDSARFTPNLKLSPWVHQIINLAATSTHLRDLAKRTDLPPDFEAKARGWINDLQGIVDLYLARREFDAMDEGSL